MEGRPDVRVDQRIEPLHQGLDCDTSFGEEGKTGPVARAHGGLAGRGNDALARLRSLVQRRTVERTFGIADRDLGDGLGKGLGHRGEAERDIAGDVAYV